MKHWRFLFVALLLFAACQEDKEENYYDLMVEEVEEAICAYTISQNDLTNDLKSKHTRFTIGHASDIHAFSSYSMENLYEFLTFFQRPQIRERVDLLLATGDFCNGGYNRNKKETIEELESVINTLVKQPIPTMTSVGNHDTNINEVAGYTNIIQYSTSLTKEEQYKLMIEQAKRKWNYNGDDNTCYYYQDFQPYNIRVINLDFADYPVIKDGDKDQLKYMVQIIFSQKQLEWFYKTLQSTPDDYGVIVSIHANPDESYMLGKWEQGVNMLPKVIDAFRSGGKYSHEWNCKPYPELSTKLDFDFTANGQKEFICWVGGHTHRRTFTHKEINGRKQLMISTSALFCQNYDMASVPQNMAYSPTLRTPGTTTQNSFNILQVDRKQHKVFVTIFGAYLDYGGNITRRINVLDY